MHLRNVELFCDIVARHSFSKAAEANHISQSAASQAVHALEKHLGALLIDRSKRPFELTSAGRLYYDGVRDLLESFRTVEDGVQSLSNKVTGRLRVAAIYSVGLLQMDAYVGRYTELYPDVELRLEYLHPDEVYDRVLQDDADLGMVSFPRDGGEIGCISWQSQPMALVVHPDHPLAARETIEVEEIRGEDFVAFRSELAIRKQTDRWLRGEKIAVNVVHEFDSIEIIKRAVEIGSGVAILPIPTVRKETETGSLVAIPFSDVEWFRPLGIIHKRHKSFTTAVSKFIELLHDDPESFSPAPGDSAVTNGNGASARSNRNGTANSKRARTKRIAR